jgi:hypothetical protein
MQESRHLRLNSVHALQRAARAAGERAKDALSARGWMDRAARGAGGRNAGAAAQRLCFSERACRSARRPITQTSALSGRPLSAGRSKSKVTSRGEADSKYTFIHANSSE